MSDEPSHGATFNENDYARPNQVWNCGWAADGHACPLGPAKMGICRSSFECAPYQKGDTWVCARMKPNGGTCDEGPFPDGTCCRPIQKCQPIRSIMSRRGVVSLCVFALAIGVAFIMIAAPGRSRMISPGPLISAHRQAVDRCEACHVAGDGKLSDIVHAAFDSEAGQQQSALCLKCHADLGANALHPHGQPSLDPEATPEKLAEHSSDRSELLVAAAKTAFGSPTDAHHKLSCATCHREHHGTTDLTAMTNQQCQVCHSSSFHSFGNGHPELENYPYDRRTRIYFDHQTHFGVHFRTMDPSAYHACRDCHSPDAADRYMLTKSFEQACAQCHLDQIKNDELPGLLMASIPAIDVESLRAAGIKTGQWPSIYPLHVEASSSVAPLLALISPRRDELQSVLEKLDGINLADLSKATLEQLTNVEAMIWAFKASLVEILDKGRPGLNADIATVLESRMTIEHSRELVRVLPLHGLATMQHEWLPNVVEEVAARAAGEQLPDVEADATTSEAPSVANVKAADLHAFRLLDNGWYLHSPSMSLRYRPTRHADPTMKTLLEFSALAARGKMQSEDARDSSVRKPIGDLYAQLTSTVANGRCTKCHTIDDDAAAGTHPNWLSYKPPTAEHGFTRFNHAPHLALETNEACSQCHEFLPNGEDAVGTIFRPEFVGEDWQPRTSTLDFSSDFAHLSKSNCSSCHTKQAARDRCTTCHNYHVR